MGRAKLGPMMVNVHDAKSNLSRLLDRAAGGEEIVIARAGKPVARLVALEPARPERRFGLMAGKISTTDDFDETPDWLIEAFEGS